MDILHQGIRSWYCQGDEKNRQFLLYHFNCDHQFPCLGDCCIAWLMSIIKNPVFIIFCLLFWLNQGIERIWKIHIPWVHAYFDDLLAMPVVLGISLQVFRWIHPLHHQFIFTKTQVTVGVVYFSLVFEIFLPLWSDTYTSDPYDVLCYGLGSILFYKLINKPQALGDKGKWWYLYTFLKRKWSASGCIMVLERQSVEDGFNVYAAIRLV